MAAVPRHEAGMEGDDRGVRIMAAVVREGLSCRATPKQLGAMVAAAARAALELRSDPEIVRRAGVLADALEVKKALQQSGFGHHNLGEALAQARSAGLGATAAAAGRRIQRASNHARHSPFEEDMCTEVCMEDAASISTNYESPPPVAQHSYTSAAPTGDRDNGSPAGGGHGGTTRRRSATTRALASV